jgi:hypothetical protein
MLLADLTRTLPRLEKQAEPLHEPAAESFHH